MAPACFVILFWAVSSFSVTWVSSMHRSHLGSRYKSTTGALAEMPKRKRMNSGSDDSRQSHRGRRERSVSQGVRSRGQPQSSRQPQHSRGQSQGVRSRGQPPSSRQPQSRSAASLQHRFCALVKDNQTNIGTQSSCGSENEYSSNERPPVPSGSKRTPPMPSTSNERRPVPSGSKREESPCDHDEARERKKNANQNLVQGAYV